MALPPEFEDRIRAAGLDPATAGQRLLDIATHDIPEMATARHRPACADHCALMPAKHVAVQC